MRPPVGPPVRPHRPPSSSSSQLRQRPDLPPPPVEPVVATVVRTSAARVTSGACVSSAAHPPAWLVAQVHRNVDPRVVRAASTKQHKSLLDFCVNNRHRHADTTHTPSTEHTDRTTEGRHPTRTCTAFTFCFRRPRVYVIVCVNVCGQVTLPCCVFVRCFYFKPVRVCVYVCVCACACVPG